MGWTGHCRSAAASTIRWGDGEAVSRIATKGAGRDQVNGGMRAILNGEMPYFN